ncbi:MAG: TetR/AcrR family transcriptional regulator [Hungatella sp.]|jgi:AcrR family transcriptional regulator|nr:TetR/AcrR family transcriptional regulator [Hungatella sp.]MCI9502112.1 TetR/AcrR family transcriptional regulator [Hungatella sp.]MCI9637491.1 TetR/AcrR family transcriptional regulator [Hungatella sp.]
MDFTKSQICETAKNMFNERGYQSVSMRQIAAAAGISLGTLTYHYAHKQDLLAAIMDSTIQTFPQTAPQDIAGLHVLFRQLLESIADARFYFNDPAVYQAAPLLQEQRDKNVGCLFSLLEAALENLVKRGFLVPELTQKRIHQLATVLMLSHTGWLQHNASRSRQYEITLEELLRAQWAAVYPYLTEKGVEEYENGAAAK